MNDENDQSQQKIDHLLDEIAKLGKKKERLWKETFFLYLRFRENQILDEEYPDQWHRYFSYLASRVN